MKILQLREEIAIGRTSEIAQIELGELLEQRQELIKSISNRSDATAATETAE